MTSLLEQSSVNDVAAENPAPIRRNRGRQANRATHVETAVDLVAKQVRIDFETFLTNFENEENEHPYLLQIEGLVANDSSTLYVNFVDIAQHNQALADAIVKEFYRFSDALSGAVSTIAKTYSGESETFGNAAESRVKTYQVGLYGYSSISKIRSVKAESIGQLMSICGTVTRTSEVRPELLEGTFKCKTCGEIVRNIKQQFKYTEPLSCPAGQPHSSEWELLLDQSIFADWQKIRVQENSSEIPAGSMPRTIQIVVRNEIVEKAKPGDKCFFTGCPIVVPDISQLAGAPQVVSAMEGRSASNYEGITGLQGLGVRDLSYKISFLACSIQQSQSLNGDSSSRNDGDPDLSEQFSPEELLSIKNMSQEPRLYTRLARCIAPNVYGHEEIKRGILLMLFGGVHKNTSDAGMGLRGDINICIVGDPSTAKSQFLKFVCSFVPRAVYTSGKASSAAGLTASVARDAETGEFGIEAGALLLADNGICCIDEFDKMDPKDQVAIHEAMEQQTISIAKAGIHATLNARASILAAANPIYGRYDSTRTLKQNINITAPIMSRFDLFYVVVDECDPVLDYTIARKIVSTHQNASEPIGTDDENNGAEFTPEQVSKYLAYARNLKPKIPQGSIELLAAHYCRLRERDTVGSSKSSFRITVRQLESMIRLSEALARLHLDEEVRDIYVNEAARLIRHSIVKVRAEEVEFENNEREIHEEIVHDDAGDAVSPAEREEKLKLSFPEYQRIANLLVLHLKRDSRQQYSKTDLIDWYLKHKSQSNEINSETELLYAKRLIEKVISRLLDKDHILIEVGDGNVIPHPNYDVQNDSSLAH